MFVSLRLWRWEMFSAVMLLIPLIWISLPILKFQICFPLWNLENSLRLICERENLRILFSSVLYFWNLYTALILTWFPLFLYLVCFLLCVANLSLHIDNNNKWGMGNIPRKSFVSLAANIVLPSSPHPTPTPANLWSDRWKRTALCSLFLVWLCICVKIFWVLFYLYARVQVCNWKTYCIKKKSDAVLSRFPCPMFYQCTWLHW